MASCAEAESRSSSRNACNNNNSSSSSSTTTEDNQSDNDGTWIGVDFGTTHCSVAVYDATRGNSKWIRLASAIPEPTKAGRILPSQIFLQMSLNTAVENDNSSNNSSNNASSSITSLPSHINTLIGYQALQQQEHPDHDPAAIARASLSSLKRTFAQQPSGTVRLQPYYNNNNNNTNANDDNRHNNNNRKNQNDDTALDVPTQDLVTLVLKQLRLEADAYLSRERARKSLATPGTGPCRHVVLGVPARYSTTQRQGMVQAARQAGFTGTVSTLTESTAAAMAYGMFVGKDSQSRRILVFDMGGGTTDVTVAQMNEASRDDVAHRFQVLATEGDGALGGDDIDAALMDHLMAAHWTDHDRPLRPHERRQLFRQCQRAKVCLSTADTTDLAWQGQSITVTRTDLETAMAPLLDRIRALIATTLQRVAANTNTNTNNPTTSNNDNKNEDAQLLDEVSLIGGSTRVPAVRQCLVDLGMAHMATSVHPMAAVALGCAIQAADRSGHVPRYELASALMLDCVPYPIGVLVGSRRGQARDVIRINDDNDSSSMFVSVIDRETPLPASGIQQFTLRDSQQAGVTILAVEQVDFGVYVVLFEFTFLLQRLRRRRPENNNDNAKHQERSVHVGMKLSENGAFITSIFDENDPEHRRKIKDSAALLGLSYKPNEDEGSWERVLLLLVCFVLLVLYVAIKIAFAELEGNSEWMNWMVADDDFLPCRSVLVCMWTCRHTIRVSPP